MLISLREKNVTKQLWEELDCLALNVDYSKRFIVLFGWNVGSQIAYQYFAENNISIDAIVDNDKNKHGEKIGNMIIESPKTVLERFRGDALILIASNHYHAMVEQLTAWNYEENMHVFQIETFKNFKRQEWFQNLEEKTPLTLKETQECSLEILKYVKELCDKNKIRYYIAYGSLLGAIRHKGFIPWDDDIDLLMPMPDFLKFCDIMKEDKKYGFFSAFTCPESRRADRTIGKVMNRNTAMVVYNFPVILENHIGIDIFPMGGYPDEEQERIAYRQELLDMFRTLEERTREVHITDDNHKKLYDEMMQLMNRYDYETSNYVGCVACVPYNPFIHEKKYYDNPCEVTYEGGVYPAPAVYDEMLTTAYGNYMEFPPEGERRPLHYFNSYLLESE